MIVVVIGLCGWSGAGKTTLIVKLIPVLISRGYAVSTLKHAHHAFDVDQPGKDSFAHRAAGARAFRERAAEDALGQAAAPKHPGAGRRTRPR